MPVMEAMAAPVFALKGALADFDQLDHRARALAAAGRPIVLELHSFGPRDIDTAAGRGNAHAVLARLRAEHPVAGLIVHVPVQPVELVTRIDFDGGQCERTLAFAAEAGVDAVVLHRYFGLVFGAAPARVARKADAVATFGVIVRDLARTAPGLRLLVENVGHYSLLPRDGHSYLVGPLDHFFPWEIRAFRQACAAEGLTRVEPFVDVAHATLSANLFNRRRRCRAATEGDPRFAWIGDDDLDQAADLHPFDFVDPQMTYLHVSDACRLDPAELARPDLPEARLTEGIVSEGLEIGTGNLPFVALRSRLGTAPTLVIEVEPGPDETHVRNEAQIRSLVRLAAACHMQPLSPAGPAPYCGGGGS